MNTERINRESVVNEVFKRITDSIIKEEIKPGEKIPTEIELMESLGVGRNSVREAIKMLTAMGVLEVRRGSGTYVVTKTSPSMFNSLMFSLIIDPKTDDELYELRIVFDRMILMVAVDKATDEDIKNIENILQKAKTLSDKNEGTIDEFVQLDLDFHCEILKATHNSLIEKIGSIILELFPKYIKRSLLQKNGVSRSINNHYKILDVIKNNGKGLVFETIEKTLIEWKNKWSDNE